MDKQYSVSRGDNDLYNYLRYSYAIKERKSKQEHRLQKGIVPVTVVTSLYLYGTKPTEPASL